MITDDLRKAVQGLLNRRLDDETWAFAENGEWIDSTLEDLERGVDHDRAIGGLSRRIQQLLEYRAAPRTGETREIPPDGRDEAFARVLVARASREVSVARFRREVLRGQLISPSRVQAWVRTDLARKGHPPFTVSFQSKETEHRSQRPSDSSRRRRRTWMLWTRMVVSIGFRSDMTASCGVSNGSAGGWVRSTAYASPTRSHSFSVDGLHQRLARGPGTPCIRACLPGPWFTSR